MTENDFQELAAGRAVNALSPDDERAFDAALRAHPEWDVHVAAAFDAAAGLADAAPETVPPAHIRASLLARIATMPQDPPAPAAPVADAEPPLAEPTLAAREPVTAAGRARRGSRRMFALAASVAVLVAVGVGGVLVGQVFAPPASVVALEQIESAPDARSASVALPDGSEATAHWSSSLSRAALVTDGLPALTDDQTYELWFVRGGEPLSAGTFSASESGDTVAELSGDFHSGDIIAVTIEPDGGSPTGLPSSDPVLAITT
ncbi:anti-sigma factor [Microbacterium sp. NPDC089189]|uniref:anti-sigma factor n=1 Tax=Microbacterium sp. NPDC089189 TaxID=3154972 RepID=UPI00342E109F